jgi:hypothetical protein
MIEEGDFFRKNERADVRQVSEKYIARSDPYTVMVSTHNDPGGFKGTRESISRKTRKNKKRHRRTGM